MGNDTGIPNICTDMCRHRRRFPTTLDGYDANDNSYIGNFMDKELTIDLMKKHMCEYIQSNYLETGQFSGFTAEQFFAAQETTRHWLHMLEKTSEYSDNAK